MYTIQSDVLHIRIMIKHQRSKLYQLHVYAINIHLLLLTLD